MYYRLHHHCKLVSGKARGAIYDLHSGKVYSINGAAVRLLHTAECPLPDAPADPSPAQTQFYDALTQKDLGGFYFSIPPNDKESAPPTMPLPLNFVWLELTSRCNNRCLHCYTDSTAQEISGERITPERWLSLLDEIHGAGCDALQLIGGEPLLYPHWRALVRKAADLKFGFIELFTNATLADDSAIEFFIEHGVHIATTIYSDRASVHDAITQNKGSFEQTLRAIKKMLAHHIPLRIASIIMKANETEADRILSLCQSLGVEATPPDVIRPTGRGDDTALLPAAYQRPRVQPPFYVTETEFHLAQSAHPCLAGKIAVTATGDVLPCIFARDTVLGNVRVTPLAAVLANAKLTECWLTTKDRIQKCHDCEYRYACHDCRPLAQSSDTARDWYAAPNDCDYDPVHGIWKTDVPPAEK